MSVDTRLETANGARRAPLHPPMLAEQPRDEVSIRSLCVTIDRLTQLIERLLEREAAQVGKAAPMPRAYLTQRELQIARLIVEGLTTPQIAERLTLEQSTVKKHRSHIRKAVGTSERVGLAAKREEWEVAE